MIITIKGASGSGKSTLVRKVMELYSEHVPQYVEGRKRPIAYICSKPDHKPLMVLGHYETDCGGCDTIKLADETFALVRKAHEDGFDVLFEGLLLSADANRTTALHKDGLPLHCIGVDIDIQDCLKSIDARRLNAYNQKLEKAVAENNERAARGRKLNELPPPPEPVNPYHTTNKWKQLKRIMERLQLAGVSALWLDRDAAFEFIKKELAL